MSESRIITDSQSGLTYHVKSFPFEFEKTYFDPEKNEGAFSGYLIISLEDKQIFNEKGLYDDHNQVQNPRIFEDVYKM